MSSLQLQEQTNVPITQRSLRLPENMPLPWPVALTQNVCPSLGPPGLDLASYYLNKWLKECGTRYSEIQIRQYDSTSQ